MSLTTVVAAMVCGLSVPPSPTVPAIAYDKKRLTMANNSTPASESGAGAPSLASSWMARLIAWYAASSAALLYFVIPTHGRDLAHVQQLRRELQLRRKAR